MLLDPVASRPEVAALSEVTHAPDRLEHIRERVKISQLGTSELYSVAYNGPSAEAASVIVNTLIDEYMHFHLSDQSVRTSAWSTFWRTNVDGGLWRWID